MTAPAFNVCAETIRNRLRTQRRPIRARRPYTGGILTLRHRRARLGWARVHRNWRRRDWNTVLFSDESRFNLSHADGRVRVYRRKGERFAPVCVRQHDRFGGGGVMVWGGIMGGGTENQANCSARQLKRTEKHQQCPKRRSYSFLEEKCSSCFST